MEELKKLIPFNAIISAPTCCGKTNFLIEQLSEPFRFVFENIVLICPTFSNNKTYSGFAQKDLRFIIIFPESDSGDEINNILKCCRILFSGTQSLIILDDCAVSKYLKKRSNEFINLAYSGRHFCLSVWVLCQKLSSISKSFRDNIGCLVAFHSPSKTETENIFDEFGGNIEKEEKRICKLLKSDKFSKNIFCLRHPFIFCVEIPSSSKLLKS